MWHSHLNDMQIQETKRFIPKGFELGTTLSSPNRPIPESSLFFRFSLPVYYYSVNRSGREAEE